MKTMKIVIVCAVFLAGAGPVFAGDAPSDGAVAASSATLPSKLVAGYRGAVIPLSGDQLLYVKKGDRVDVLVTFEAIMGKKGETTKEKVTATILQNIVVRAPGDTELHPMDIASFRKPIK